MQLAAQEGRIAQFFKNGRHKHPRKLTRRHVERKPREDRLSLFFLAANYIVGNA